MLIPLRTPKEQVPADRDKVLALHTLVTLHNRVTQMYAG
jgi:hypothetical protein